MTVLRDELIMEILQKMEAGVYSLVETQWDATCPKFYQYILQKIKDKDTYAQIEYGSKLDEVFQKTWKPGGIVTYVSG